MKQLRMSSLILLGSILAMGATAKADVVINFTDLNFVNTAGNPDYRLEYSGGQLIGELTAISGNFQITAGTGDIWANDLGIFISNQSDIQLASNGGAGLAQVGGFANAWGAAEKIDWANGGGGPGGDNDTVNDTRTLTTPITFNGNAGDPNVFLGHLYNSGTEGTWTGSITLVGVSVVPEPTGVMLFSISCLGLGLMRRR